MRAFRLRADGRLLKSIALLLAGSASLPLSAQDDASLFNMSFRDATIEEVMLAVHEATGRTIIPDPRLRGLQVTLLNRQPMTADQFWEAFLQILQANQYAAVESQGIWRIVPDSLARTEASVSSASGAAIATRYIALENASAAVLGPVFRPLMSTAIGNVTNPPGTNVLLLTDRADNIARLVEIINVLDADAAQITERVALEFAAAEDVSQKLSQLVSAQASSGGGIAGMQAIPDERTNSIILAGSAEQVARFRPLVDALDQPATQGGGSEVRYLYYADAEELAGLLSDQFGGAQVAEDAETAADPTGGNISVAADVGTNSLVMRAPSQILRDMLAIVDALDIPRAQVHIQAIIVEMSESRAAEFGLTWVLGNEEGDSIVGLTNFTATTGGILQLAAGGEDGAPNPGLIRDGVTAAIGNITDSGTSWAAVISALQGDAQTNIVQMPNVTVLDNTEAEIRVGQQVPFVTGQYADPVQGGNNVNPFQNTQREPVGTSLLITPRIDRGRGVQMAIVQEVSSISESEAASDVITNERNITTSVYVEDGQVLVLGGLMDDKLLEGEQKVPWFGNIPGLGWLFKARNTTLSNTVMMVFIRPTILRDGLAANQLTSQRYQLLLDEQERRSLEPVQLMKDAERPTLPPLEALQSPPSSAIQSQSQTADPAPVPTE